MTIILDGKSQSICPNLDIRKKALDRKPQYFFSKKARTILPKTQFDPVGRYPRSL